MALWWPRCLYCIARRAHAPRLIAAYDDLWIYHIGSYSWEKIVAVSTCVSEASDTEFAPVRLRDRVHADGRAVLTAPPSFLRDATCTIRCGVPGQVSWLQVPCCCLRPCLVI